VYAGRETTEVMPRPENATADAMMNTHGFSEFLGVAMQGKPFTPADNLTLTREYYVAFLARRDVEVPLIQRFQEQLERKEGAGIIAPESIGRLSDALDQLAARNPKGMIDLQRELEAIKTFPEDKERAERELAEARNIHEQNQAMLQRYVNAQHISGESLRSLPVLADLKRGAAGFFQRVGEKIRSGFGETQRQKVARESAQYEAEVAAFGQHIVRLQSDVESGNATLESLETQARQFQGDTEVLEGRILKGILVRDETTGTTVSVLDEMRKRLSDGVAKKLAQGLLSSNLQTLLKTGQDFSHFETLLRGKGVDYLSGQIAEDKTLSRGDFATALDEKILGKPGEPGLFEAAVMEALGSIEPGATQSRMDYALVQFADMTAKGLGTRGRHESVSLLLTVLTKAYNQAIAAKDKTGKAILLAGSIAKIRQSALAEPRT
jgi:hypothetical protein